MIIIICIVIIIIIIIIIINNICLGQTKYQAATFRPRSSSRSAFGFSLAKSLELRTKTVKTSG